MATRSDISIIGLGAMGSALARAQLKAGHRVTVWNRTSDKAALLASDGAWQAKSCADAVAASPVLLVCLTNYPATERVFEDNAVIPWLVDRTFIQLSTGTPQEARQMGQWVTEQGASYLDGAIKCYPDKVGAPESRLFICGEKNTFSRAEPFLRPLCGSLTYLGDKFAAAAALDLGLLTISVALYAGVAQGARICAAEGAGLDHFASMISFGVLPRNRAEIIHADSFTLNSLHPGASLEIWADAVGRIQAHSADAGLDAELPNALASIYQRALDAGLGSEDIAALYKVLGESAPAVVPCLKP